MNTYDAFVTRKFCLLPLKTSTQPLSFLLTNCRTRSFIPIIIETKERAKTKRQIEEKVEKMKIC